MKNVFKRLISAVLAFTIILNYVPTQVFAQGDCTSVTYKEIIQYPNSATLTNYVYGNIYSQFTLDNGTVSYYAMCWYDTTENKSVCYRVNGTDEIIYPLYFDGTHTYKLKGYIEIKDGTSFSNTVSLDFKVQKLDGSVVPLRCTTTSVTSDKIEFESEELTTERVISALDIILERPVGYYVIDDIASFLPEGISSAFSGYDVLWYKVGSATPMEPYSDAFVTGQDYYPVITIKPKAPYVFSFDEKGQNAFSSSFTVKDLVEDFQIKSQTKGADGSLVITCEPKTALDPIIRSITITNLDSPICYANPDTIITTTAMNVGTVENYGYGNVKWYESGSSTPMADTDTFQPGKTYYPVIILICPAKFGYSFDSNLMFDGTINACFTVDDSVPQQDGPDLVVTGTPVAPANAQITSVTVSGLDKPVSFANPDTEVTVTTVPADAVIATVTWMDDSDYPVGNTDTYDILFNYSANITLKAKDGYEFPSNGGVYQGSKEISGFTLDTIANEVPSSDTLLMKTEFVAPEKIEITSVEISGLDKPVSFAKPDTEVTMVTSPADAATVEVRWLDNTGSEIDTATATFDPNKSYTVKIIVTPKEGYTIPADNDGVYTGNISLADYSINSKLRRTGSLEALAYYGHPEDVLITSVKVKGLDKPVLGGNFDYTYTIETEPANAVNVYSFGWCKSSNNDPMLSTDEVVIDEGYYAEFILSPKDGYTFGTDTEFAGTKEIEGHDLFTYDEELLDDGRMMLRTVDYYFPATVTDLTVNFTQPECDQTPDFTPTVTTNLPDGQIYLDPDRISWSDVAGWGMTQSDTFEAGHTYVVEAYFDSNYELTAYPADSTGAFTGTLNLDGMTLISAEVSNGNSLYIVAYKEIPLTFLSDETTTFTQGNAPDLLTIRCNGSIGDFDHLEVNGQRQEDDTYELTEGSTIVTFDKSYLNTLQPGTYNVAFVYNVYEIVIKPGIPSAKASKASISAVAVAPLASYESKIVQKTATVRIIVNTQATPQKPATGVGDISFVYITFLVSCMGLALLLKEKIQLNK